MSIFIRVRLRLETLWGAIRALKETSRLRHDEARLEEGHKRADLRREGDASDAQAEEIKRALNEQVDSNEPVAGGVRDGSSEAHSKGE